MTVPKPLDKVNKRYDLDNGLTVLYVQIVVPTDKATDIRQKLNNIIDWFMSRNKIKGLNKKSYDMSPVPYDPT
jgi:hypothetical protein